MKKKSLFEILCQNNNLLNAWKIIKQKGSSGGIDGISISLFEDKLDVYIKNLQQELIEKRWQPQPYLKISIPKKQNERRILGLLCIKDKIVQQAIKQIVESKFEKIFVGNSYGYRYGKGHTKAVRFARFCCQNKMYPYVLRLDIDNYFDTIDHEILFKRVYPLINDDEIFRLIQLCVKMGMVSKQLKWNEIVKGVPQGAVLSPLLANFYLHSFDQFVLSRTKMYVRYADDFIILCKSNDEANKILSESSLFLEQRLKLTLNSPTISEIKNGIEFLGILIDNKSLSLTPEKREKLIEKIKSLKWENRGFNEKGIDELAGIYNYYMPLLPQELLKELDKILFEQLQRIVREQKDEIPNKSILSCALKSVNFLSEEYILKKSHLRADIINEYLSVRTEEIKLKNELKNKKLISKRKREYRQKENEASELIVNTYGAFIGVKNKGITVKSSGKKHVLATSANLRHITILSEGVGISSNALAFCMQNNIGIDYFSNTGKHYGSFISTRFMHTTLWDKQYSMPVKNRLELAVNIITGKIKNQTNLIKYFHKYHKGNSSSLIDRYNEIIPLFKKYISDLKSIEEKEDYAPKVISIEAKSAELYWSYIKELINDDDVGFIRRERHGATDLVNCLLNYGYSILYPRVWQGILYRKLNPTISVIHAPQAGKPTFVYDVIELFRAQAVDRVVISLIQKKEPLKLQDGLLDKSTKRLLVQNILERINRYEKYHNKELRLCDIINLQIKEIAEYIDNGTKFKPYISKW